MERGNNLKNLDPRTAMTHFAAAAQAKPGQVAPVSAMGDCAANMGNLDQARRHYENALRLRDSYGPALIGMARIHKRTGDSVGALRFYRRYLEVNSRGSQADEARAFVEAQQAR
jgi:Tfp pilus assembly protein PilF